MKRLIASRTNKPIEGEVSTLAADKSISHRAAIFSLLSDQPSTVENFLEAEDTLGSLSIAKALGATVSLSNGIYTITPPTKIVEPSDTLDCGNAGTAMRIYAGLLAAKEGFFVLSGDRYLNHRPMRRVVAPLRSIGANIDGREGAAYAPLAIRGNRALGAFNYQSSVASAQVKSAMILAALSASGESRFSEPELSRDHTERMLQAMGASIKRSDNTVTIAATRRALKPLLIRVPADPSSGFFFAVAAAITRGSDLLLKGVTLNPTRIEAYKVLRDMGARVEFLERENIYEPIGDIRIGYGGLNAIAISERISWLIDELPALAIAFSFANGTSRVTGAQELRVKESDRIKSIVANLKLCGVQASELPDGFEITGQREMNGGAIDSFGDHRIAMSFAIASLGATTPMIINDTACIATSFPNFVEIFSAIGGSLEECVIAD
ncbi:3-phosphoshikimate 1-carboxyvinyltransferase [Campylobacterota bacterium]|nr:3-phosphoshikimate 1-carboxyvinyltransferase [Campylobacterota bacterium]